MSFYIAVGIKILERHGDYSWQTVVGFDAKNKVTAEGVGKRGGGGNEALLSIVCVECKAIAVFQPSLPVGMAVAISTSMSSPVISRICF